MFFNSKSYSVMNGLLTVPFGAKARGGPWSPVFASKQWCPWPYYPRRWLSLSSNHLTLDPAIGAEVFLFSCWHIFWLLVISLALWRLPLNVPKPTESLRFYKFYIFTVQYVHHFHVCPDTPVCLINSNCSIYSSDEVSFEPSSLLRLTFCVHLL